MKNTKKSKSIKFYKNLYINFFLVLLFVFLPIVTSLNLNGQNFLHEIKQYEYKTNLDAGYKTQAVFDNVLSGVNVGIQKLWSDKLILDFISNEEFDLNGPKTAQVMSLLKGALLSEEYVINIQFYSRASQILMDCNRGLITKKGDENFWGKAFEWFNLAESYTDRALDIIGKDGIVWKIEPYFKDSNTGGYIAYEIDFKALAEWIIAEDATFDRKDFFIINDYGEILYYNGANNLYRNIIEGMECSKTILSAQNDSVSQVEMLGRDVLLSRVDSKSGDWIYAIVDHANVSAKIMNKIDNVTKVTFFSIFIVCIISVLLITTITYFPVLKIVRAFTSGSLSENGNSKKSSKIIFNETAYIINSMMDLLKNNKNMEKELEERIKLLNKSQAQVLQIQTDPHFLYNSLDTIRWVSIDEYGRDNNTAKMIEKLSKLYRQYFRTDNTIITVGEEIEILDMYMSIINVRFEDKIKFTVEIPQEFLGTQCLKMCLQPILENSIQHGLRPLGYKGEISISLNVVSEGVFEFRVRDTGVGLSMAEIISKNNELSKRNGQTDVHIGLMNVNERIKLLYGDEYGVRIEQPKDRKKGLITYIRFPFK